MTGYVSLFPKVAQTLAGGFLPLDSRLFCRKLFLKIRGEGMCYQLLSIPFFLGVV
jgi:hypothetical protein